MKRKAPLALMEQMIMLAVFALAAALCLQAFVKADHISLRSEEKSRAALAAQDVAELLRYSGKDTESALSRTGELTGGVYFPEKLVIYYDRDWNVTQEEKIYYLTAEGMQAEEAGLQKVLIRVETGEPEIRELLFELQAAWLEVNSDE